MRVFWMICFLAMTAGCATDVVVSSGTAAETKKQESAQAAETKKKAEKSLEESLEANAARKKQLEEQ